MRHEAQSVAVKIALPAALSPYMRVRVRLFQMPAAVVLIAPALGQLRQDGPA
jgi:hypothetical protein